MRRCLVVVALMSGCKPCEIVCTQVPVPSGAWDERDVGPERAVGSVVAQDGFTDVLGVGDVDGDSVPDVAVLDGTAARVFSGSALALGEADVLIEIAGVSGIAAAGDIDRDGRADVAAGGAQAWEVHTIEGLHATIEASGGGTIASVAGGGDVDGDGDDDLIVSQWFVEDGRDHEEVVRMTGLAQGGTQNAGSGDAGFGAVVDLDRPHTLAILGDLDGDGLDDVAAGAARNFAAVHLASEWGAGPFGGLSNREVHLHDCWPNGDDCGAWVQVAAPGDVDGDGRPDLIAIGQAPSSAWVIPGADLENTTYKTGLIAGTMAERREILGASALVGVGDIDGQTTPEGVPFQDLVAIEGSEAWLVLGSQLTGKTEFGVQGAVNRFIGFTQGAVLVAGPGDLTGDGLPDLVIGGADELFVVPAPPVDAAETYEKVCEEVGAGCKGE